MTNTTKTMIKSLVVRASGPALLVVGAMGLASIADLAYSNLDKLNTIAHDAHEYITELDKEWGKLCEYTIRGDTTYRKDSSGNNTSLPSKVWNGRSN